MNLINKVVIFLLVTTLHGRNMNVHRDTRQRGSRESLSGNGLLSHSPRGEKQNPLGSQRSCSSKDNDSRQPSLPRTAPQVIKHDRVSQDVGGLVTEPQKHKDRFMIWLWPAFGFPRSLIRGSEAKEASTIWV